MSQVDKIGDAFLWCSGWMAVEWPLGLPASHLISASMKITYGLATGTEFNGSRIDRSLANAWRDAVEHKLLQSDDIDVPRADYRSQLFYKRLGYSIEQQNEMHRRNHLYTKMHEHTIQLMEEGLSRRDAQRRVIETLEMQSRLAPTF